MTISVSTRSKIGAFAFWTASVAAAWRPLAQTFALALREDAFTYVLIILPVSAVLLYLGWQSLQASIAPSIRKGSALLLIAIGTACVAFGWRASMTADVQLSVTMFALVLWWIGTFVFWFGDRAGRLALFPLCFLFGLVPLPRLPLNAIVAMLQSGSAWTAHGLFVLAGVPVDQSGVFLAIPGLTIQVAQECSSIRSSSLLLATTIVLAQLVLYSPWRKALVIALAVPLSIAKNGLRVFIIGFLGTRVDPGYLTGRLHHQGGIVFFALALLAVFTLLWLLRRGEQTPQAGNRNMQVKAVNG